MWEEMNKIDKSVMDHINESVKMINMINEELTLCTSEESKNGLNESKQYYVDCLKNLVSQL